YFFFQAEDGIRDRNVTGVQTCALPILDRYQRQSKEFKQSIALELIHGKSFKDVADRFHTSTSTVIRRFDTINADMLKEPKQLPSVIAIDEYKGDAGGEKYQTI